MVRTSAIITFPGRCVHVITSRATTVADGLTSLLALRDSTFATERFQQSMQRCFQDVGLAPIDDSDPDNVIYKEYKDHKHGSMNPNPLLATMNSEREYGSVAMATNTLDGEMIETRLENQNADLSDDEGPSDTEGDDSSSSDDDE